MKPDTLRLHLLELAEQLGHFLQAPLVDQDVWQHDRLHRLYELAVRAHSQACDPLLLDRPTQQLTDTLHLLVGQLSELAVLPVTVPDQFDRARRWRLRTLALSALAEAREALDVFHQEAISLNTPAPVWFPPLSLREKLRARRTLHSDGEPEVRRGPRL